MILDMMNGEMIIPMEKEVWWQTARTVGERDPGEDEKCERVIGENVRSNGSVEGEESG